MSNTDEDDYFASLLDEGPPPEPGEFYEVAPEDSYLGEDLWEPPTEYSYTKPGPNERLDALNPEQKEAASLLSGIVRVVAGPGSGKTRVLTERVVNLVHEGVSPSNILVISFTRKAANEVKERILNILPSGNRMWIMTFHGLCLRMVQAEHEFLGLPKHVGVLDTADSKKYQKAVAKEYNLEFTADTVREISMVKNTYAGNLELGKYEMSGDNWSILVGYEKQKHQMGVVDFDDLQILGLKVMKDEYISAKWRTLFKHVSVDEYQDTNPVQVELVKELGKNADSLFVVGDADQSIYRFRGAVPGVMEGFHEEFPGTQTVVLEDNYRSTPQILNAVRSIIEPNPADARGHYRANRETGKKPSIRGFADDHMEQAYVVRKIVSLIENDVPLNEIAILAGINSLIQNYEKELLTEGIPCQLSGRMKFFERKGVKDVLSVFRVVAKPRDYEGFSRALSLYPGMGVKTVNALIRNADKAGLTPLEKLKQDLAELKKKGKSSAKEDSYERFIDLVEDVCHIFNTEEKDGLSRAALVIGSNLPLPEADKEIVAEFALMCEKYETKNRPKGFNPDKPTPVTHPLYGPGIFYEDNGWWKFETVGTGSTGVGLFETAREEKTYELGEEGSRWLLSTQSESGGLIDFIDFCTLDASDDSDEEGVVLSTIHAAKGREFSHVFVVAAEEGFLPRQAAIDDGPYALQEERRLMFVAISRAKDSLELVWARRRFVFGNVLSRKPSRYLYDIEEHSTTDRSLL